MVFPATPAVVTLKAAFGADVRTEPSTWVWTDITGYWEAAQPVTVRDGRSEGATQAEASEATLTLNATDGAMMPDDPRSPYWPHVDVGTPVWMVINAGEGDYNLVQGFVSSLKPERPGRSRYLCWVRLTVRGILDQLGRGSPPVRSPLQRTILAYSPVVYLPLTDGTQATIAGSIVPGQPGFALTGTIEPAKIDGPIGDPAKLPELCSASETGVPALTVIPAESSGTSWTLEFVLRAQRTGSYSVVVPFVATTAGGSLSLTAVWTDGGGSSVMASWSSFDLSAGISLASTVDVIDEIWHQVRIVVGQSGSTVAIDLVVDGETVDSGSDTATIGAVTGISVLSQSTGSVASAAIGHIALYPGSVASTWDAFDNAYSGEAAADRIARLCGEDGVRVTVTAGESEALGPQPPATFLDLLRECEAADGGRLGEDGFGLAYRPRSSLYNQTVALTLDGAAREVADPFVPTRDLQRLRNEWRISRKDGASAVYADEASQQQRGRLASSAELNVATDDVLLHHAQWRVWCSSSTGLRHSSLSTNLGRHPGLISNWQTLALGDLIRVINPPMQPGSLEQLVEGRSQTLNGRTGWQVTLVTAEARPYEVVQRGGTGNRGRRPTSTSTLASAVTSTTATFVVTFTTSGAQWSAATPYDIEVGGEQMTVTSVLPAGTFQQLLVTRAVNGVAKTHPVTTPVRLWRPPVRAL